MAVKANPSKKIDDLLAYLFDLNRFGVKVGLDHTIELLKRCGNPQNNFHSIHIAGTNGKGSTSSMVASILMQAGYKVGLYSSPHLINFNERIRVNNICITNNQIASFIENKRKDIDEIESTFFETTTAMAFQHFSLSNVDIAVIETGLGGRLDATNVLNPIVTAITSISLDHRELLGNDIITIAKEKAGIIKTKVPVVIYPQKKSVQSILLKIAAQFDSFPIEVERPEKVSINESGTSFLYKGLLYKTPLIGKYQAMNGVMAINVIYIINNKIKHKIIQKGLNKTLWPGRLQRMNESLPIYYDVCHNVEGISLMLENMKSLFTKKPLGLFVIKRDKEVNLLTDVLTNKFHKLVVSGGENFGLLNGSELSSLLYDNNFNEFHSENNFNKALDDIFMLAKKINKPAIIFGSHYIAKPIFDKFGFYY